MYSRTSGKFLKHAKRRYERIIAKLGEENWKTYISNLFKLGEFADVIILAEEGYAESQYELGIIYIDGILTQKNVQLGQSWLEKAGQQYFCKAAE